MPTDSPASRGPLRAPRSVRLGALVGLALATLGWTLLALRAGPLLLPTPWAVLVAFAEEPGRLLQGSLWTALGALGGFLLATALGTLAAVLSWWSRSLRDALTPATLFLQVVPIVAIAPLLVVWFGYGLPVALTTASIAAFYPVYSAASTGLASPAQELVDLLRCYGATRWQELRDLRLRAALPALFSGLRSASGLAVIGAIVGEFVGSNGLPPTLGQIVVYSARSARPELCFAAIACAGALVWANHAILARAEARAIGRWFGA